MELHEYLNDARLYSHAKSDRDLSRKLGVSQTVITNYRTDRAWPSDENMVKIALLGRHDPADALLDLKQWSVPEPALSIYKEIAKKLHATAAVFLLVAVLAVSASPSIAAGTGVEQVNTPNPTIYIMRFYLMSCSDFMYRKLPDTANSDQHSPANNIMNLKLPDDRHG